jgi:hypothetical protein
LKVLKIDLDIKPPKEWIIFWWKTRQTILQQLGYTIKYFSKFETKRGMHIYITLEQDVSDETANMLQFLLGDDHTRVKINQWRIKRGIPRWNKLFHKVLYRKKAKTITCHYCGNKIPIPDRWIKNDKG